MCRWLAYKIEYSLPLVGLPWIMRIHDVPLVDLQIWIQWPLAGLIVPFLDDLMRVLCRRWAYQLWRARGSSPRTAHCSPRTESSTARSRSYRRRSRGAALHILIQMDTETLERVVSTALHILIQMDTENLERVARTALHILIQMDTGSLHFYFFGENYV